MLSENSPTEEQDKASPSLSSPASPETAASLPVFPTDPAKKPKEKRRVSFSKNDEDNNGAATAAAVEEGTGTHAIATATASAPSVSPSLSLSIDDENNQSNSINNNNKKSNTISSSSSFSSSSSSPTNRSNAHRHLNCEHAQNTNGNSNKDLHRMTSAEFDPQGILNPETVSVKQRFQYARRMQQMREKERMEKVKLDPKQTIMTARQSFYDGEQPSPASKAFGDKFASGMSTDSLWTETVENMKIKQQERSTAIKSSTVAYSQQLQKNRVVTQRISQWEELFIQTETTAEELAQIWKIVKEYFYLFSTYGSHSLSITGETIDDSAGVDAFHGKLGVVDNFTLGGTRVYSAQTFGSKASSFLEGAFLPQMKYMGLVSGVFSEKAYKPPLRVIAMALRGDSGAFYFAITIKPLAGHEDDPNLLGNRKIIVFNPNNTSEKLFDIAFQIVFTPPERDEVDVHDCNSLDAFDALVRSKNHRLSMPGHDYTLPEEFSSSISAGNSPYVENVPPIETEKVAALDMMAEGNESEEDNPNEVTEEDHEDDDEDEPEEESEVVYDDIEGTSASSALSDGGNRTLRPMSVRASGKNLLSSCVNFNEGILSQFDMDEPMIDSVTSSSQYMIIKCCDPDIKNILITSSGNSSAVVSQNLAESDQVFEWIRGVAASGWMSKFPTSKSYGRYVRRFFILQDNTLTYYKYKPGQEEFFNPHEYKADIQLHKDNDDDAEELSSAFAVGGYYVGGKTMIINDDTLIEQSSIYMQPILKISTPSTQQTLVLRLKRGSEKEKYWINALKRTMEIQAMKRTSVSPTIKTLWLHENPTYELVTMDVKINTENNHHLKAALFFCELPAFCKRVQLHPNAAASRYILDLENDQKEKMQLELLKTNEKPFNDIELQVVKIFGDVVVLGGNEGFVGIGTVGMTTDLTQGSSQRILYVIPCRADLATLQRSGLDGVENTNFRTGHSAASTIKCIATCLPNNLFVVADDELSLSVWLFEQQTDEEPVNSMMFQSPQKKKAGFYYKIKPQIQSFFNLSTIDSDEFFEGETIVSMSFLYPDDFSYLLVSTTKRLLLLSIGFHFHFAQSENEESRSFHQVVGYAELDRVTAPNQFGLFSLASFDVPVTSNSNSNSSSGVPVRSMMNMRKVSISASMVGKNTGNTAQQVGARGQTMRRIIYWKALKNDDDLMWTVCKGEVSEEKLHEAILSIRPLK